VTPLRFYVSWYAHDPEYQKYDADCSVLVSPVSAPKSWTLSDFELLPRSIMLDSGSYSLLRNPVNQWSPSSVLTRQLHALQDYWRNTEVTLCHLDRPVLGADTKQTYDAIEATIANAYELKSLVQSLPQFQPLIGKVKLLGVIQGVDAESIQYCARELVRVGLFDRFGLGSLAPLMDPAEIGRRVQAALRVVDDLHIFGVSSLTALRRLRPLGVRSFDSSRPMKAAINCTLLYGSPLKCHTIAGTLRRQGITIRRARACSCPICTTHRRELVKVGAKKYNNLRALHNYLVLKRELCGVQPWTETTAP
jgi:tRNA-guanine family transglycosylase